jgi:hypothetical protein
VAERTFDVKVAGAGDLRCSPFIPLPAGTASITERATAGMELTDISTSPAERLVSEDLAARTAVVTIVGGDLRAKTVVFFRNRQTATVTPTGTSTPTPKPAETGFLEICKEADTQGTSTFDVAGRTFDVTVAGAGDLRCSPFIPLPEGTASITERAVAGMELIDISTSPAERLVSEDLAERTGPRRWSSSATRRRRRRRRPASRP